jgi:hypothetical protein
VLRLNDPDSARVRSSKLARNGWQTAAAAAGYVLLSIVFTWPLALGLARDIPNDYGDPLLNAWIMAWDATHAGRGWWNANIFAPHPLTLAYSEHLAAQAATIAPIYWATDNPILCYNLVFLSTYVLSGLGVFLLARELTGSASSAWIAGVAYAFAPFRVGTVPHIQVLSSGWMPFVLFAWRRYFRTGSIYALAGAAAAWIMQNLSCGYYLLYFAPVAAGYLAWELTTRRLWRDLRVVIPIAVTCVIVGAVTVPFLLPYVELRSLGFDSRSMSETRGFSADVFAYFTADPNLRLWGPLLQVWPRAEGSLFPGLVVVLLAAAGCVAGATGFLRVPSARTLIRLIPTIASAIVALVLLTGWQLRTPGARITSLPRALVVLLASAVLTIAMFPDIRQRARTWLCSPAGGFTLITLFAVAMSFGPRVVAGGRVVLDVAPYDFFYRLVPGFDGLRVPARYGMIVTLGLSVLAACGLTAIVETWRKKRRDRTRIDPAIAAAVVCTCLVAAEGFGAPIPINQNGADYKRPGLAPLPLLQVEAPPVYDFIRSLPPASVILELPLGEPAFDLRYMFYSRRHWRPIVNGYSGGQPKDYALLDMTLQDFATRPETAWTVLRRSGATHVVVHESCYAADLGARASDWLRANGAREITVLQNDRVFQLPDVTRRIE